MKNNNSVLVFLLASLCRMPVASWILLLFSLGSIAGNTALAKPVELNLKGFRESSRILVGKLPIRVAPRREYLIKAGASGLIELYVPPKPGNFKAGDRLGGIDVQRLELDEELMTLSESLLKEKEIPQWKLDMMGEERKPALTLARPPACGTQHAEGWLAGCSGA